ncbi:MAG: OmpA family protein [Gammaproteobacteria bacterium]|nr:OmpA family protein [Gammaproteobacteria bacterium]
MSNSVARNIFLGLAAGTLLTTVTPVLAEYKGGYLGSSGKSPVHSGVENQCVRTPNQRSIKRLEECGDKVADEDGDGVADKADKCPNTPSGVAVDAVGCAPDNDNDGVMNDEDSCPNNTEEELSRGVGADGCPQDSDGDGIPNYRDTCPNTPADRIHKINDEGCAGKDDVKFVVQSLTGEAHFDFDKAMLKAKGRDVLDRIARVVNAPRTEVQDVQIVGYTDSIGTRAYNQELSERRARTVGNYLISKGVDSNRIVARGEGKKNPVATNKTKEGRAKNRRVVVSLRLKKAQ